MILENKELENTRIYDLALKSKVFYEDKSTYLPVDIGFYLYRNLRIIKEAAGDIDAGKRDVLLRYSSEGTEEEDTYYIPPEKRLEAQQALTALGKVKQHLPLYLFTVEDFKDIKMSGEQLEIISEMIIPPEDIM